MDETPWCLALPLGSSTEYRRFSQLMSGAAFPEGVQARRRHWMTNSVGCGQAVRRIGDSLSSICWPVPQASGERSLRE